MSFICNGDWAEAEEEDVETVNQTEPITRRADGSPKQGVLSWNEMFHLKSPKTNPKKAALTGQF